MATLIPQSFINDLLTRIDIVEIINPRVHLRKAGSNFQALCPFHNEKTPSFSVSQRKQFYHCFGCGAHGNAISFIMNFEKLTFVEAVETLAAYLGLEVPRTTEAGLQSTSQPQTQLNELCALLLQVSTFYQQQLEQSPLALDYLKKRGVSPEICKKFKLGFAPSGWEHLNQSDSDNDAKIKQQLLATGMLIQSDQPNNYRNEYDSNNSSLGLTSTRQAAPRTYARFRHRLMFPIHDRRGRIIGFGGRTMGDDIPKYLNSPETPLFHKGNELYGLYEARQSNRNLSSIIVVEGYMDVIALAQHHITNTAATLGTAITAKQIQQLLQNCKTITFCFDGDNAGKTAAWRALENALPLMYEGIEIKFVFLPEQEDPDTIVRKEGREAFLQRLTTATPLSDFLFQQLTGSTNINTLDGRAKLIQQTQQLLQRMSNGVFKQMLLTKLAEITKTSISTIRDHEQSTTKSSARSANTKDFTSSLNPIQMAIGLLLNYPELATTITEEDINIIVNLNTQEAKLLIDLNNLIKQNMEKQQQNLTLGTIIESWRYQSENDFALITKIAAWEPLISHAALKNEFCGIIQRVREYGLEFIIQTLLRKASSQDLTIDEKVKLQDLIKMVKNRQYRQ